MVIALFILTLIVFLSIDYFLHKEERAIKEAEENKKAPIFLSPEKALITIAQKEKQLFHLSHSWIQQYIPDHYYLGFDNFISTLFSSDIKISTLPKVGSYIKQGDLVWNLHSGDYIVSQLAPISGFILEINPACKMGIPLATSQLGKSWILKLKADPKVSEIFNLMNFKQADIMNSALKDELLITAQDANYLNDGGVIDPDFINNLSQEEWDMITNRFFPYMKKIQFE